MESVSCTGNLFEAPIKKRKVDNIPPPIPEIFNQNQKENIVQNSTHGISISNLDNLSRKLINNSDSNAGEDNSSEGFLIDEFGNDYAEEISEPNNEVSNDSELPLLEFENKSQNINSTIDSGEQKSTVSWVEFLGQVSFLIDKCNYISNLVKKFEKEEFSNERLATLELMESLTAVKETKKHLIPVHSFFNHLKMQLLSWNLHQKIH